MVRNQSPSSKIEGGFLAIPVARLLAIWRACGATPLRRADFRTWLAAHEMRTRRSTKALQRSPNYTIDELASLLGGLSQRRVRASIRRLVNAQTIVFAHDRIEFPDTHELQEPIDAIGQGRGDLIIPRRILRFLVADASPALTATALAVLLRCLSRRRAGFNPRGRLKASWIARLFDIDLRRVKAARAELLKIGWITPQASDQHAENRWGRAFQIDLAWDRPSGAHSPLPTPTETRDFATPISNLDPLREKNQHQEPAPPAGTGFQFEDGEAARPAPKVARQTPVSVATKSVAGSTPTPSPRLEDIQAEDLRDTVRLLELHRQAVDRRLVSSSEADRLKFVALAEHARAIGQSNPPGLFAALLRRGAWSFITQAEEDAARRKLKSHFWGASPVVLSIPSSKTRPPSVISTDARIVREIKRSLGAAGYRGDAFPQLRRIDPSWTRSRWDAASNELLSGSASSLTSARV